MLKRTGQTYPYCAVPAPKQCSFLHAQNPREEREAGVVIRRPLILPCALAGRQRAVVYCLRRAGGNLYLADIGARTFLP